MLATQGPANNQANNRQMCQQLYNQRSLLLLSQKRLSSVSCSCTAQRNATTSVIDQSNHQKSGSANRLWNQLAPLLPSQKRLSCRNMLSMSN
jgi:hypothetical protein